MFKKVFFKYIASPNTLLLLLGFKLPILIFLKFNGQSIHVQKLNSIVLDNAKKVIVKIYRLEIILKMGLIGIGHD